jgi:hypothetical protein
MSTLNGRRMCERRINAIPVYVFLYLRDMFLAGFEKHNDARYVISWIQVVVLDKVYLTLINIE